MIAQALADPLRDTLVLNLFSERISRAVTMIIEHREHTRNEGNRLSAPAHIGLAPARAREEQPLNEPAALLKYR